MATRKSIQPVKTGKTPIGAQPSLRQRGRVLQSFGTLVDYQLALSKEAREASVEALNQILADTLLLVNLYKKHHWQVTGPTFYQLHLLFEKHFQEQVAIVDLLGERVQTLGGVAIAAARDVGEKSRIERAPADREQVPVQISRTLDAHEVIITEVRAAIELTARTRDWGTNDLLMSDVLRAHEKQVWFLSTHLVKTPLVCARR